MKRESLRHKETLVLETLMSGLDARETARGAADPMLLYLSEMLIERAHQYLATIRQNLETAVDHDA